MKNYIVPHRRHVSLAPAAALLALLAAAACTEAEALPDEQRPNAALNREFASTGWDKTLIIGGAANDSALISPYRISVTARGISLVDFYPRQVQRYTLEGELLWTFGAQGAGPGEFLQPQDMKLDPHGRAWVLDPGNARLTIISAEGSAERMIPLKRLDGHPHEVIPLPGDRALVVLGRQEGPYSVIDTTGRVLSTHEHPSPMFARMNYLASQLITGNDPGSGAWVSAYRMGDGFFAYRDTQQIPWRGWFVEEVAFPEVVTTRSGQGTSTRHRERPVAAARSVTLSPEHVYVLFGGVSDERNRIVDRYALATGIYEASYLLPEKVNEIAWHDGALYAIIENPYPEVSRFRLASGELLP